VADHRPTDVEVLTPGCRNVETSPILVPVSNSLPPSPSSGDKNRPILSEFLGILCGVHSPHGNFGNGVWLLLLEPANPNPHRPTDNKVLPTYILLTLTLGNQFLFCYFLLTAVSDVVVMLNFPWLVMVVQVSLRDVF